MALLEHKARPSHQTERLPHTGKEDVTSSRSTRGDMATTLALAVANMSCWRKVRNEVTDDFFSSQV